MRVTQRQSFYDEAAGTLYENKIFLCDLDYRPMKLFLLSLLWRFGVTSIPFYQGAYLREHREQLRQMLCVSDPGVSTAYGCMIIALTDRRNKIADLIVPPEHYEVEGYNCCFVVVGGYLLIYFLGTEGVPFGATQSFLRSDGSMPIAIEAITKVTYLRKHMGHFRHLTNPFRLADASAG